MGALLDELSAAGVQIEASADGKLRAHGQLTRLELRPLNVIEDGDR